MARDCFYFDINSVKIAINATDKEHALKRLTELLRLAEKLKDSIREADQEDLEMDDEIYHF